MPQSRENIVIATPDFSDNANLQADSTGGNTNVSLLQRMSPRDKWQSAGLSNLNIRAIADAPQAWNLISLLYTNASEEATWQLIGDESSPAASPFEFDSTFGFDRLLYVKGTSFATIGPNMAELTPSTDWTLECFVRPDRLRKSGIFAWIDGTTNAGIGMNEDGVPKLFWDGEPDVIANDNEPLDKHALTHLAMVYQHNATAAIRQVRLYVNGNFRGSHVGITNLVDADTLQIAPAHGLRLDGAIDDCRMWHIDRTEPEIRAALLSELVGNETNLEGYWKLNGNYDDTDANMNDAVPSGAPFFGYPDRFWASPGIGNFPNRHSLFYQSSGFTTRVVEMRILDPNNVDGFLTAGRLFISNGYQPAINWQYGGSPAGFRDDSVYTQSVDGEIVVRRVEPRTQANFNLQEENESLMYEHIYELDKLRGASRDVLVVMDPGNRDFRFQQMHHGLLQRSLRTIRPNFGIFEHSYTIQGLVG